MLWLYLETKSFPGRTGKAYLNTDCTFCLCGFFPSSFLSFLSSFSFLSFRFVYLSDLQVFWVNKKAERYRILIKQMSFPFKIKISIFYFFSLSLRICPNFTFLHILSCQDFRTDTHSSCFDILKFKLTVS